MAYSINPNLPKARATAMQLLVRELVPVQVVANHCGIHRTTVWRWKRKWDKINENVQLTNDNRPTRPVGSVFRISSCSWNVPTLTSRPHTNSLAVSKEIVTRILALREQLKRCAEVVWHYITTKDGVRVSLSSVRRTLKRHHCFDGARKNRVRPDNPKRPQATSPGELVQTDTVHYICPLTGRRRYVYTVIDLYSRMAHAEIYDSSRPGIAASVVVHASKVFGFAFSMVQADNGSEFSHYFEKQLARVGVATRHSRLGRPNDNAFIERFNRTIQEECLGSRMTCRTTNTHVRKKLTKYLAHYNTDRVHLGIQLRTPAEMLQRL
jgi:putative transposase